MRLGTILAFVVILLSAPVFAQPVEIRSGEHPGFTRLVFQTATAEPWELGRGPDGYLLRFENQDLSFDFGGVFRLIPRRRLAGIRLPDPGLVALDVSDGVYADAFTLRPGVLVVDFRSGRPAADSPFETALALPDQADRTAEPSPAAPDVSEPPPTQPTERAQSLPPPKPAVSLPLDLGRNGPLPVIGPFLREPGPVDVADPRVASVQSELMKQIGRAAAQGLLEPAIDPVPTPKPAADAHPADEHRDASAHDASEPPATHDKPADADPDHGAGAHPATPEEALVSVLGDQPHIRIETSIDRGLELEAEAEMRSKSGVKCLPDADFDFAAWGADRPAGELIAEKRAALLDIRDEAVPEGTRDLALAYLALGMGTEARAVISDIGLDDPRAPVWRELGAILDDGVARDSSVFDGQLTCPSRSALWAMLARPSIPPNTEFDRGAVLRGFSELPEHLRRHLGPILADRLLAAGFDSLAISIRDAARRVDAETPSSDLTLVDAKLDLAQGNPKEAQDHIDEVLTEGGLASADALALQLETELDSGRPPSLEDVALAEALAFERRETPMGKRLVGLAVRAHAVNGDFQTAFDMVVDQGLQDDADLVSEISLRLAKEGSDVDLVQQAFAGLLTTPDLAARPKARLALADRLTRLGFAGRAEDLLASMTPHGGAEERLVRARLSLAQNQPGQALQYLAGLEGEEADLVRAEAARQSDDLASAARYYGAVGDSEKQAAFAWQARDWETVEQTGTDLKRTYVQQLREAPAPAPETLSTPSLSGAQSVLEGSEAMRESLRRLLNPEQLTQ